VERARARRLRGAAPKGRGRFWIFFHKGSGGGPLRARPLRGAMPNGKASALFEGQAFFFFFTKAAAGGPRRAHRLPGPTPQRKVACVLEKKNHKGSGWGPLRMRPLREAMPQRNWGCAVWTAAKTRHVTCACGCRRMKCTHTPQATHLLIYIYRMCVACVMCVRSSLKDFTNEVA
jgi:hypothetical protein